MQAMLTRLGFARETAPSELRSAREYFDRHHHVRLPGFVDRGLLRVIQRSLRNARFEEKEYADVGHDLTLTGNPIASVLNLLMNDPGLFRLIRQLTGCGQIGCFTGRLYQMVARRGMDFTWHDDAFDDRMAAISINLSDERYEGGVLQMREKFDGAAEEVANQGFGDAIIFRVDERLEHRVTPVRGRNAKTAFTGWFRTRPRYTFVHRELMARSESAGVSANARRTKHAARPSPSDTAKIPSAVVSRTAEHETVVANIGTAMCYGLNQTGSRIWEHLAQGNSLRAVSAIVAEEYGAPSREVERDVLNLADQLARRNLIRIVHGAR